MRLERKDSINIGWADINPPDNNPPDINHLDINPPDYTPQTITPRTLTPCAFNPPDNNPPSDTQTKYEYVNKSFPFSYSDVHRNSSYIIHGLSICIAGNDITNSRVYCSIYYVPICRSTTLLQVYKFNPTQVFLLFDNRQEFPKINMMATYICVKRLMMATYICVKRLMPPFNCIICAWQIILYSVVRCTHYGMVNIV